MSTNAYPHSPAIAGVSIEDFKRFLREKLGNDGCTVCGHAPLAHFSTGDGHGGFMGPAMMVPQPDNPDGAFVVNGFGRPMGMVGCPNCGFTRMHDMFIVSQWARSNPKDTA